MRFVDEVLRTPGAYPGECESTLTVYTMGIRPADEPPGGRPHFPTALLHAWRAFRSNPYRGFLSPDRTYAPSMPHLYFECRSG